MDASIPGSLSDIFLLNLENPDTLITVVDSPANEYGAHFSPDGLLLAYTSVSSTGESVVLIRSVETSDDVRQVSSGGGTSVRWSTDPPELYFWRGNVLFSVPMSDGAPMGERALFDVGTVMEGDVVPAWYDVTDDGSRFLVAVTNPDSPAREIRVTLNWMAALER